MPVTRVLNGQIRRGDGETIRAALVMGDMRQSTLYAEKEGRQAYIDTLNEFFDAIAAPFNRNGGEILSFLGDGFLAVYPCGRHKDPPRSLAKRHCQPFSMRRAGLPLSTRIVRHVA